MIKHLKSRILATAKGRQLAIYAGIVGAALLTSVSIFATGPNASPEAPAERAWPVSVTAADPRSMHPTFSAFGRLEANRIAHLRCDLIAQITAVRVKEGDWVEAGDIVVRLDERQAKLRVLERAAELRQHQANLAAMRVQLDLEQRSAEHFNSKYKIAQDKLTRHQDLMAKRLISKSLLDEVVAQADQASIDYRNHLRELSNLPNQIAAHEASVARADALLEYAKLDLEKTVVRAPFAGPILAVHAAPGDHSNLSESLVDMADASTFEVRVQIPDAYAQQFQALPNLAKVTAVSENGGTLTLTRLASHVRTGQTGTDAFFEFKQNALAAPALGRVFSVNIEMPAQNGLIALPVQSIYENNRIYAVKDSRLVGHTIERVGEFENPENGYQILIRSKAILPGEPIITTQLPRAITGLLVDVATDQSTGIES